MNFYLIGYRGVGKSTLAPLLAARIGWDWLDLDAAIERRVGRSIRNIFTTDGEAVFRDFEEAELAAAAEKNSLVVATGGGVVIKAANRVLLRRSFVAWLTASPEVIHRRIVGDGNRPSLTDLDLYSEIERLLAQREPLYREAAHIILDASAPPAELAAAALDAFTSSRLKHV